MPPNRLARPAILLIVPLLLAGVFLHALPPAPAEAQANRPIMVLREAYEQLQSRYVDPLRPADLLTEAWGGATAEATAAGVEEIPALPSLPNDSQRAWTAFARSYAVLELAASGKVEPAKLAYAAIEAMTKARDECHTFFLPPDQWEAFRADIGGRQQFVGIGVTLSPRAPFTLTAVFPDGPASRAGLLANDVIVAVDGTPTAELNLEALRGMIRGDRGAAVTLRIQRPGEPAPLDVTLTRDAVTVPVLTSAVRPDGIGVITLNVFATTGNSERMVRQTIADFEARGVKAWVLDLRGNGGGSVPAVQSVLGALLPPDTLVMTWDSRAGESIQLRVTGEPVAIQRPLAVLVGPATGSGAEISAAVLQDTGRARIFGRVTAACANVGLPVNLPDGSGMTITAYRELAGPSLRVVNGVGVTPDEVIEGEPDADLTMQAAARYLQGVLAATPAGATP